MDGRFSNPFVSELEDPGFILNISNSPPFSDEKTIPAPSPKRSKRAVQKRVVSVPISDIEGSRLKGEGAPPSDSWACRKYGQKPIKGSPYPRGYYRCSSSKGCPARKQVERSRTDPTKLVITYACDHNHVGPLSKSSSPTTASITTKITTKTTKTDSESTDSPAQESKLFLTQPKLEPETELELGTQFTDLTDDPLITSDDLSWFSDVASTSPTLFETQLYMGSIEDADMAMIFPMEEENEDEDKSLFADLGELPECSVVFRRAQRCNLRTSLCGSTG